MKEHILKDKILKYLSQKDRHGKRNSPDEIANHFNVESDYVIWCLDNMFQAGHIGQDKMSQSVQVVGIKTINWITPHGRFFLNQRGGYTSLHKSTIWKHRKTVWTTALSASSTFIIIIISIWGVYVADKSNQLDNAQVQIDILTNQIDSLNKFVSKFYIADSTDTSTAKQRIP